MKTFEDFKKMKKVSIVIKAHGVDEIYKDVDVRDILFVAPKNIGDIDFFVDNYDKENGDIFYESALNHERGIVHFEDENPCFFELSRLNNFFENYSDSELQISHFFYKESINQSYWLEIGEFYELKT